MAKRCTFIENILSAGLLGSIRESGVDLSGAILSRDKKLPSVLFDVFWAAIPEGLTIPKRASGVLKRDKIRAAGVAFREIEVGLRERLSGARQVGKELVGAIGASTAGETVGALIGEIRGLYLARTNEVIQDFKNAARSAKTVIGLVYDEPSVLRFVMRQMGELKDMDLLHEEANDAFLIYWKRFETLEARYLDLEALSVLLAIAISAGYAVLEGNEKNAHARCEYCRAVQEEYIRFFTWPEKEINGEGINRSLVAPVDAFLDHLEEIILRSGQLGIVTICIDSEGGVAFDVDPPEWEKDPECRVSVLETIVSELSQDGAMVAVILRTLTQQIDPQYNVPIKELRGYRLSTTPKGELRCLCLSQARLFSCCTTDSETGEPVPPEGDVVYISDEQFTALDC